MRNLKRGDIARLCVLIVLLALATYLTIRFYPWIHGLTTEEGRQALKARIEGYGILGNLVYIIVWVIQIIIAVIPGEPIEIIGGMLFGMWHGLLLSFIGVFAGTVIVFYIVKLLGKPVVNIFVSEEKLMRFRVINDERRLELLIFILFFIPGTPKDALTYIVPLTPIAPLRFFVISVLARIPSIASSVLVGATLHTGNLWLSILIFLATGAIGVVGILCNERFMKKLHKKRKDKREDKSSF